MIEQAERKIETLTLQKTDDLVDDLEIRLNKLKVIETEINPDLLVPKVKVLDDFKKREDVPCITVNSSPYAVDAYERLGFCKKGEQQEKDGIIFVPMIREL